MAQRAQAGHGVGLGALPSGAGCTTGTRWRVGRLQGHHHRASARRPIRADCATAQTGAAMVPCPGPRRSFPLTTRTAAAPESPATGPTDSASAAAAWLALPAALRQDLRTDHAGEAGAVMIYRGVLALARCPALRDFACHHLQTEQQHLALIEAVVPPVGRSRLLPLWRVAGWVTGALPAVLGPRAVYATIDAVETFVDRHYADQVRWIDHHAAATLPADRASAALPALRSLLECCRRDEVQHRDDARARRGAAGGWPLRLLARAWSAVVGAGSAAAVRVSRRV